MQRAPRRGDSTSANSREPASLAAWIVVGLAVPYTLLNTLFPGPLLTYALGLALALLALGVLIRIGIPPRDLFLRVALPSRVGAALLGLLLAFIPGALLADRVQPLAALDDLVYAPLSALSQELYFRSALLVALTYLCRGRSRAGMHLALALQAGIFALWHARAFTVVALLPALGVLVLAFIAGLAWGAQVQRDRTLVWCTLEHTLFLIVQ